MGSISIINLDNLCGNDQISVVAFAFVIVTLAITPDP